MQLPFSTWQSFQGAPNRHQPKSIAKCASEVVPWRLRGGVEGLEMLRPLGGVSPFISLPVFSSRRRPTRARSTPARVRETPSTPEICMQATPLASSADACRASSFADPPEAARNNISPDMTPTGVRYSLIRAACRRQRRWVRRVLADIPPRRSHPPTAASPAARRSANAAQAPACRARMNSGI
jgi:hypothetical protein